MSGQLRSHYRIEIQSYFSASSFQRLENKNHNSSSLLHHAGPVDCCFAGNAHHLRAPAKYGQTKAEQILDKNGIGWDSGIQPRCTDRNNPNCTCLEGINVDTIENVVKLHNDSKCPIVVKGGTEVGHAYCKTLVDPSCNNPAERSHWNWLQG